MKQSGYTALSTDVLTYCKQIDCETPIAEKILRIFSVQLQKQRKNSLMNIVLWILQILLALAFGAHGVMMVAPPPEIAVLMAETMSDPLRLFIGIAEILAAIGLILPGLTRILPWLTALASAGLVPIMIGATVWHFSRGEISSAVTTAVLFVLTLFVAYMRWKVKPIAPRGLTTSSALQN